MIESNMQDYGRARDDFDAALPETYNAAEDICDDHVCIDTRDKVAMFYESDTGDRETYTYWELKRLSDRVANFLSNRGLEKGDRVAVHFDRGFEAAAIHLGTYKAGGVVGGLSPKFGREGLKYRINDSGCRLLFTEPHHLEDIEAIEDDLDSTSEIVLRGTEVGYTPWGEVTTTPATFDVVETSPEDPMQIFYTSGTTGMPKGVVHAHKKIYSESSFAYNNDFHDGELYFMTTDWAWVSSINAWMGPLKYGSPILVYGGQFEPEVIYDLLERYQVTNFNTVPTGWRMLREEEPRPDEAYDLSLRHASTGGEPLTEELYQWAIEYLDVEIKELYGQTEVYATANYPNVETKPGSAGLPLPGTEIWILDEDGNELDPNTTGEVAVKRDTPMLFQGYWQNEEATEEVTSGEWHLTGDAGYIDEDGYLWIEGRADNIIISSGYRIGPYEVESTVEQHEAVSECAVIGVPDEQRGEVVKAFITLVEGYEPSESLEEDIQQFVKDELAAYEYPRVIQFIEEFPRTVSQKIKRAELEDL